MHPAWLILLASLWIATACNVPLWRELLRLPELDNLRGLAFGAGFAVAIAAAVGALLTLLAWRWTLKPAIALFVLAAAFGAYFMMAYGVVIDTPMVTNVLQTNPRETLDLLNLRLLLTVLVLALLPLLWLWRTPVKRVPWLRRLFQNALLFIASCALLAGTLLLIFQDFSSVMRNHTQVRYLINPLNSLYALVDLASKPFQLDSNTLLPLGEDARLAPLPGKPARPPLLVLVLGETARSGNFALNGYGRPTNPKLAGEDVQSFRNAWSCGTSTAASLPCMFSHLGRQAFESRKANYENLLDVLQRAGLAVLWIDNQSGCKGVCDRVAQADTSNLKVPGLCEGGECFDEIMLNQLDQRIAALPAERRAKGVVIVMHQMGSHGPAYYKRVPAAFKKFQPECTSNALQDCAREQVVNAFDNTILYTDQFLSSVIGWLKAQEPRSLPAMLYVSDHGESLGENNLYLHGLPYSIAPDVQKHVPWITWLSPAFAQAGKVSTACLKQRLDAPLSHDNYFHSVLGLLHVQTAAYQPSLDMFRPCTTP
ncbi:phosphoethanolamine--lipid A transferase [Variovorax sp. CYS-02]|uniref:Phosphoethanolamine--lipid A transferase n=2 Tax=Variovorax terrae TaxID=2923278 RepID=A0A9X1VS04_9BURK|nr:phosphoethanolamine--lipid A transferase [Variovorax terrae]MCJ0762731.1 phosphoethanolamine--lipid A transferase [Variovorax terrae]